jgi:hypothetical protein
MAEEGNLGLMRAQEEPAEDLSKEDLQRRLEHTRDAISHTVTEIKETVQHQVQAVKETLDWKEQFRKRPVAWSAGAAGVGFCVGYCIAATAKGEPESKGPVTHYRLNESSLNRLTDPAVSFVSEPPQRVTDQESGPSWWQKLSETPAYDRVRSEAGSIGEALVQELSNTAKQVVLPAVIASIRSFLGAHLPAAKEPENEGRRGFENISSYQPKLERNQ